MGQLIQREGCVRSGKKVNFISQSIIPDVDSVMESSLIFTIMNWYHIYRISVERSVPKHVVDGRQLCT